ncbi:MAG: YjfB family protein [Lachnospiraceae bacterium]|nr:YjfB family protein [Lachnospiraceae bacterium]
MVISMDIAGLSMSLAQTNTLNDVGTAMLAKSLDMVETMGDSLTNLIDSAAMERSVNPAVGGNIDIMI